MSNAPSGWTPSAARVRRWFARTGDLTFYRYNGSQLSDSDEESPGGVVFLPELNQDNVVRMDISVDDSPDPGGEFHLNYFSRYDGLSSHIQIYRDDGVTPLYSGDQVTDETVYVEGLYDDAYVANTEISLSYNRPNESSGMDFVYCTVGELQMRMNGFDVTNHTDTPEPVKAGQEVEFSVYASPALKYVL